MTAVRVTTPASNHRSGRPALTKMLLGAVLSSLIASSPAAAYVRYLSDTDCPYAWRTRSIKVTAFPQGLTDMTVDEIENAATLAADAWSKRAAGLATCTDLDIALTSRRPEWPPPTRQPDANVPPPAAYDHHNNLVFRDKSWCAVGPDGLPDCHDPSALAITSVFAKTWGEIVDADIEVNALNFSWTDLETSATGLGNQDLQNALTHELGHLIGLDHSCWGDQSRAQPKDQNGDPVPTCSAAPASVRATTMFASADPGDVSKRTLEPDDQQAVCDMYPAGRADLTLCPAPAGSGCQIAATTPVVSTGVTSREALLGGLGAALALTILVGARGGRRQH